MVRGPVRQTPGRPFASPLTQLVIVPRKPNYNFEKRRKELDRQARKEEKRNERARRRREGATEEPAAAPPRETPSEPAPDSPGGS